MRKNENDSLGEVCGPMYVNYKRINTKINKPVANFRKQKEKKKKYRKKNTKKDKTSKK